MSTTTTSLKLTKPDVNDKVEDTISALATNFGILDALFPVGTIYQSTKSTNPSTFLGGTWTALTGRVLVGAGTDFPAGTTGGEKTHTLTIDEMPAHTHVWNPNGKLLFGGSGTDGTVVSIGAGSDNRNTSSTGSGAAHNNMPPYKSVYMWERTA